MKTAQKLEGLFKENNCSMEVRTCGGTVENGIVTELDEVVSFDVVQSHPNNEIKFKETEE